MSPSWWARPSIWGSERRPRDALACLRHTRFPASGADRLPDRTGSGPDLTRDCLRQGTRRLVTCTASVAAPRSKVAGEMFLAMTRTVLLDQAAASSSTKRVDEASAALARSPCRAPDTVTSTRLVAPGASDGRSQATSAVNSRCPACQSARKRPPRSACKRDPPFDTRKRARVGCCGAVGAAAANPGAWVRSETDQARFLNRQLSLPVSTMSQ